MEALRTTNTAGSVVQIVRLPLLRDKEADSILLSKGAGLLECNVLAACLSRHIYLSE